MVATYRNGRFGGGLFGDGTFGGGWTVAEGNPMNTALETALRATLTGGTALTALLAGTANVFNAIVPRGQSYPCVLFGQQAGTEANDSPHRSRSYLYLVKGISATSISEAGSIEAQIDPLLHEQILAVAGWTNYWMVRETDVRYAEVTPEGAAYYHSGGVYRIRIAQ